MALGWREVAFQPGKALAQAIAEQWLWLTRRSDLEPFFCSQLGDVFATDCDGRVHWLSCSAATIGLVAASRTEFDAICERGGREIDAWFGLGLIERLHAAGSIARHGEAYMFLVLPIFPDCRRDPDNLKVKPANDIFIGLAELHQLYSGISDGSA